MKKTLVLCLLFLFICLAKAKNYAVCIHGPSNTLPKTIDSIKKNIFGQVSEQDKLYVFYHTFTRNPLPERDQKPFQSDFKMEDIDLLNSAKSFISSQIEFDGMFLKNPLHQELMKQYSSLSLEETLEIYRTKHAVEKLWKLAFGYAAEHSVDYDHVIYLRSDYEYLKAWPLQSVSGSSQEIHMTTELTEKGVNDQVAFGSVDGMRWFANRKDYELPCSGWLAGKEDEDGVPWNAHRFIKVYLASRNVGIRNIELSIVKV